MTWYVGDPLSRRPGAKAPGGDVNLPLETSVIAPTKKAVVAKPAAKPDVLGAFRQAGKGLQSLKELTNNSRSPSKRR